MIRVPTMQVRPFVVALLFLSNCFVGVAETHNPPNIVVIVTDDQRYDDLDPYMPVTRRELFDKGASFPKAYITTPACCPSRASIFTGSYASQHEVIGNPYVLRKKTFFAELAEHTNYYTGIVGKYLNSWDGRPRKEFDYWVSQDGGDIRYNDPTLNVNGEWRKVKGYSTLILGRFAEQFLKKAKSSGQPFLLYLAFNAPHYPARPHKSARGLFVDEPNNSPAVNEADRSDKPAWIRKRKAVSERTASAFRKRQRQCLWTVDKTIDSFLLKLQEFFSLEDTVIIFLSDNGVFHAEHTLTSKDAVYEEAIRVPFAIRWDKKISPGVREQLIANIDIAPTILELAGVSIPASVRGKSLLALADGGDTDPHVLHSELLIEGFRETPTRVPFYALHTGRWVYVNSKPQVRRVPVERELYDLKEDPHQLNNLAYLEEYQKEVESFQKRLESLVLQERGTLAFDKPEGRLAPHLLKKISKKRSKYKRQKK